MNAYKDSLMIIILEVKQQSTVVDKLAHPAYDWVYTLKHMF